MLEEWALGLANSGERAMSFLLTVAMAVGGGIGAVLFRKDVDIVGRAPFFAWSGVIYLPLGLLQFTWLWSSSLIAQGNFWILILGQCLAYAAAGIFYYRVAAARSRDIRGNNTLVPYAFIPLANLWLVFAKSGEMTKPGPDTAPALLRGYKGVAIGFGLFAAFAAAAGYAQYQLVAPMETAAAEVDTTEADALIQKHGLDAVTEAVFAEVPIPYEIDPYTSITRIEIAGPRVDRDLTVTLGGFKMTAQFKKISTLTVCSEPFLRAMVRAGGTISDHYLKPDGTAIGTLIIDKAACGD
ncbi:hypothetical protein [Zavarzinia compransoris]|uniref:Uncharacterized protein n=1 Tax=Zavarzinia compransoris TaxID=1264899 RepID=A0A317DVJ9_9PROT|nr:hypothetical protein [Zavarzinia compransoris]PWR18709.1 hypothetical protein DKG75_17105 [Zavarzinia compransoris]TDP48688.1 hypothetical protein DES42_10144 [Zavarzinia compransoris]